LSRAGWVVVGGKRGEVGHCERCGIGLRMELPMPLYLAAAMMKAFAAEHAKCQPEAKP